MALVAGRKRVPRPATGRMALRMGFMREDAGIWRVGRNCDGHLANRINCGDTGSSA
jgi:hypothetical protein